MKFKISVALVTFFMVFSACKKTTVFNGAKVHTLNDFVRGYSETFTYNDNGTVSTMVKNNGIKQEVYYSGDSVTVATLNGIGQTTSVDVYVLNSSGYATSWQGGLVDQNNSGTYAYDGNGMFTQAQTFVNHTLKNTDNYTNNSTKNAVIIQHVNVSTGTTYDYYTYFNSNGNTVGVQNMGQYYLGVSSANLIATDVKIGQTSTDTLDIITYGYRYNGSSDVDTLVSYHRNGTLSDSITYTYY